MGVCTTHCIVTARLSSWGKFCPWILRYLDTWMVCLFACINHDHTKQEHKNRTYLTSGKHALWQTTKAS